MSRDGFAVLAMVEEGNEPPEWFTNAPEATPTDEFYLNAFWTLDTGRARADGYLLPIHWRDILEYGAFCGLEEDNLRTFFSVVRAVDIDYVMSRNKKTSIQEAQKAEQMKQQRQRARQRKNG